MHLMKRVFFASLVLLLCLKVASYGNGFAKSGKTFTEENKAASEQTVLKQWKAGQKVSLNSAKSFGLEQCFTAEKISDRVFQRMRGKSYPQGCSIPRASLRYVKVLHYTPHGDIQLGELVCHQNISADIVSIFKQLFEARYPIERMTLIDDYDADDERSMTANNTSCFNYRVVAGSKKLSKHSQGRAIDINPLYNPCVRLHTNGTRAVTPKAGKEYANRNKRTPYGINRNDLCYRLFTAHGFIWGGNWRTVKDYQHFEK